MRTLFLGSYGFGNLGDELCLIDAVRQFKPTEAWAFSVDPEFTRRCTGVENYIQKRAQIADVKPERIVLGGGGVGFWPSLRDSLHWMAGTEDYRIDAELHVYNIGVGKITAPEWFEDATAKDVIARLSSYTVRDHVSYWLTREWNFGRDPGLTFYPERTLPPEPFELPVVPGPLVGISITGQAAMVAAMEKNRDRISAFVRDLGDFTPVPIVSTVQDDNSDEDDVKGFEVFADMFLKGRQLAYAQSLDRAWWKRELTPLRLKYLISKLDLLVSQRKHNIIHAIGTKTRFVGIFPDVDDSILRIFFSLRFAIPPGSSILSLDTGAFEL
ncbi:MAG: hypothetical protein CFE31_09905 [Rhizobiales bacterium PAR1]|nr:MAG: hypothetical protein CFE31_09905 [Rhizobiales bacterium PAR1]